MRQELSQQTQDLMATLKADLIHLHLDWEIFLRLFCHDSKRSGLLADSAGSFFSALHRILLREVASGICKLLDREHMGKNKNRTLEAILNSIGGDEFRDVRKCLNRHLQSLRKLSQPLREFRNKLIAHRDDGLASGEVKLPKITEHRISRTLQLLSGWMNVLHRMPPENTNVVYDSTYAPGHVECLIDRLSEAKFLSRLMEKDPSIRRAHLDFRSEK